MGEITKRQHNVQLKYMESWSNQNYVWMKRNNSQPKQVNPINVNVEKLFYKIGPISDKDRIAFLKIIGAFGHGFVSEWPIQSLLDLFAGAKELIEMRDTRSDFANVIDSVLFAMMILSFIEKEPEDIKKEMNSFVERLSIQTIEDFMCTIEEFGYPVIQRIIDGQQSLGDEEREDLIRYVATSYMRTGPIAKKIEKNLSDYGLTITLRPLLTLFYGLDFAFSLSQMNTEIIVLKNQSGKRFITGSQPCVNLDASDNNQPVSNVHLFFPITPVMALLLTPSDSNSFVLCGEHNEDCVNVYNAKIAEFSNTLVAYDVDDFYSFGKLFDKGTYIDRCFVYYSIRKHDEAFLNFQVT